MNYTVVVVAVDVMNLSQMLSAREGLVVGLRGGRAGGRVAGVGVGRLKNTDFYDRGF